MRTSRITLPATLGLGPLDVLSSALDEAALDPGSQVIAFGGASEGVFCKGMDLEVMVRDSADASVSLRAFATFLSRIRHLGKPTIAVVDGEALGGGVGIAAACDRVIATPRATFALPEVLFGLLPAVVLPVLMERMRPQKARLWALSGSSRTAVWAKEQGLVDDVVQPGDLEAIAGRLCRELSRARAGRITGLRRWMSELVCLDPDAALGRGAAITAELVRDPAARDAIRSFLEEGVPPWTKP